MPFFDMSLAALEQYLPERSEPADFDNFWQATLEAARQFPLNASFEAVDYGLRTIAVYDVTYAGYGGQPVKGWFLYPAGSSEPLPCVVQYIGYGGGRGLPTDWLAWPSAGYASLVMDTRGQGSVWLSGDTPDLPDGANPFTPGFMTQGILDPRSYYYRRVFTDAVRAVETVRSHPMVDIQRIALTGNSQGGGITIATAALLPDEVAVIMPNVPFLCHYRRAVGQTDRAPYSEIVKYLSIHRDHVKQVFETLDYFDGLNFAPRIKAQALFSTGLMDLTCPPSTVFAVYNHLAALKEIKVYDYNDHEGGGNYQQLEQIRYLNALWGAYL